MAAQDQQYLIIFTDEFLPDVFRAVVEARVYRCKIHTVTG
jgi:hypothetical protein